MFEVLLLRLRIGKIITPNKPHNPVHTVCMVCTTKAKAAASFSLTPKQTNVEITMKCQGPIAPCTGTATPILLIVKAIKPTDKPKSMVKSKA